MTNQLESLDEKQKKQQTTDLEELDRHIEQLMKEHSSAARSRISDMADPEKLKRVNDLSRELMEAKQLRLTLLRAEQHEDSLARSAAYKDKKATDQAALVAKNKRLQRLDQALDRLVREYLALSPGSHDVGYVHRQLDRVQRQIINESRRK